MGISRSTSRARWAWRMSRSTSAAVGPADLGEHLAGGEVDDLVDLQALVRLAPAQDGNVDHRRGPQGVDRRQRQKRN